MAIARSPSAGLPIAIEVAIDAGRTGETRRSSANAEATGRAALGLAAEELRLVAGDEPEPVELLEALPDLREHRARADRHHDRDGVSQPSCSLSSNASVFEPSA